MVRRTFQEHGGAGLYGVVAVQWILMLYSILYIVVVIMAFGRHGRYTTFGLILFCWVVFLRTLYAHLLRLPRTPHQLYFRTAWYAPINITHYTSCLPSRRPSMPTTFRHHIVPSCPLLPLRNPGYEIECLQSCASCPNEKSHEWPSTYAYSYFRYQVHVTIFAVILGNFDRPWCTRCIFF